MERLVRLVEEKYPLEACGIILGRRDEDNIVIKNYTSLDNDVTASEQGSHFAIDPLKLYEYEKSYINDGAEIIGFYHSHPDAPAIPSDEDKEYMIPELLYLILEVQGGIVIHKNIWKKSIEDNSITRVKIKFKGE